MAERGYAPNPSAGQLYSLKEDLPQRRNRYAEHPEKVRELSALLEEYRQEGRSAPVVGKATRP